MGTILMQTQVVQHKPAPNVGSCHMLTKGYESLEMLSLTYQIHIQWGAESFKGDLLIVPTGSECLWHELPRKGVF